MIEAGQGLLGDLPGSRLQHRARGDRGLGRQPPGDPPHRPGVDDGQGLVLEREQRLVRGALRVDAQAQLADGPVQPIRITVPGQGQQDVQRLAPRDRCVGPRRPAQHLGHADGEVADRTAGDVAEQPGIAHPRGVGVEVAAAGDGRPRLGRGHAGLDLQEPGSRGVAAGDELAAHGSDLPLQPSGDDGCGGGGGVGGLVQGEGEGLEQLVGDLGQQRRIRWQRARDGS
ncbi:MAG: hypothetical protein U0R68_16590 [Candidatus Nanopelagicales bacterium]